MTSLRSSQDMVRCQWPVASCIYYVPGGDAILCIPLFVWCSFAMTAPGMPNFAAMASSQICMFRWSFPCRIKLYRSLLRGSIGACRFKRHKVPARPCHHRRIRQPFPGIRSDHHGANTLTPAVPPYRRRPQLLALSHDRLGTLLAIPYPSLPSAASVVVVAQS